MGKRSRRRQAASQRSSAIIERGFDFGYIPKVVYASTSSLDFNNLAIKAQILGCAYGYSKVEEYSYPIPHLTLISEDYDGLRAVAKCLEDWGCEADGDVVDINIVLKNDGGYLLGVQPDYERLASRITKDSDLLDAIYSGATWIKTMDSTNPILYEFKNYLKSRFSPVQIGFATAKSINGVPQISSVTAISDAVSFIKFNLKIETEDENPNHWFFSIVRQQKRKNQKFVDKTSPTEISKSRRQVINSAFPVSRERIRRLNIHDAVITLLDTDVRASQIEQAVISLQLSREWLDGIDHYAGLKDLEKIWWDRISSRVEICGSPNMIPDIPIESIVRQLSLDVEYVLRKHGATVSKKFHTNQQLFLRLGYGDAQ